VLAAEHGYTRDYVARLARTHRIVGRQFGAWWYVDEQSFQRFLVQEEKERAARRIHLAAQRRREYEMARAADTSEPANNQPASRAHKLCFRLLGVHIRIETNPFTGGSGASVTPA
jgi:hypothetical protein